MPSVYPGNIDSFEQIPEKLSGEPNHTIVHQKLHDVVLAIENALGVNPGDRITAATTTAAAAQAKATTAQNTADAAAANATAAKTTANSANTFANTAYSRATTALTNSSTATTVAYAANNTANIALDRANDALAGGGGSTQFNHQIVTCGSSGVGVLTLPTSMGTTDWGIMLNPIVSVSGDVFVARAGGNPLNNTQIHVVVHKNGAAFAGGIGLYYIAYKND